MRSRHAGEAKEVRSGVREVGVRIVRETGKPIAHLARDLGSNEGTLGNWMAATGSSGGEAEGLTRDECAGLAQLRHEPGELRLRDVLKRGVVLSRHHFSTGVMRQEGRHAMVL